MRMVACFAAAVAAAALSCGVAGAEPSVLRVVPGLPTQPIAVVENRASVIESARPFVEVSIAQPEIADISPLSDRAIYLFGRSRGTTTMTVLGEGGEVIANALVHVVPDIAGLQAEIDALLD